MKYVLKNAPKGEALFTRLITLLLGAYGVALVAQGTGILSLA
mgnify:CR=1 FL=1|tara:strand:- start:14155 stop:14280 length:126 start_codon:yes stop_codon:yes gene_type:complete